MDIYMKCISHDYLVRTLYPIIKEVYHSKKSYEVIIFNDDLLSHL